MRVLHFYSTYYPDTFGGAELAINQICESTFRHGVRSTVLVLSPHPTPRELPIDRHLVTRCKSDFEIASNRFSIGAMFEFAKLAKSHDIVHFHFPWPFADFCQLMVGGSTPYVVTYHSDIVKQKLLLKLYSPLMHNFLRRASAIIATSSQYLASSKILARHLENTFVAPLALELKNVQIPSSARIFELKSRLPARFFLFIGVLRYYKGLHLLIESVRGTDIEVVIAGTGPEEEALKRRAQGLRNVHFMGKVSEDDKVALLSIAYGFVFPSHLRSEAFGMALLEACAFRLPLITFEIGTGTSHVNSHEVTGFVLDRPDDANPAKAFAALREAMKKLLEAPALARSYGDAARIRVETCFNPKQLGEKYALIYQMAMGDVAARSRLAGFE